MSNVEQLENALDSIDDMTDAEYTYLYEAAKQLDENCGPDIVIDWPEFIEHRQSAKKMLMQSWQASTL